MSLLKAFRKLRAGRSRSAAADVRTPDQAGGLDAFASEAPPPARPKVRQGGLNGRPPLVPAVLAVLVLLQIGPTFLWLKGRVAAAGVPAAAAAEPPPPAEVPTATSGVTAACEPAPEPAKATPPPREARRAAAPAPSGPPPIVAGLIAVAAPVPMQVYARGQLVGTTEAETIMLPVGRHELEFANEAVGYRVRRTVTVQAGRTSKLQLEAPSGTLHVNASPWAEVWIDNRKAGETPIGNLQTPIGTHEVVFRHPELGERRTTVLVTLKGPARVSMDLRQK